MILRQLRSHQWKAFRRHPMFERNMVLKIFTFIVMAIMGLQFFALGFMLHPLLSEVGHYNQTIDTFNSILIYVLLFDFLVKYIMKRSQTMQIAPYLTLPVKRKTLFNFLLVKEFVSFWNVYLFIILLPFIFWAIPIYYGYSGAFLYSLFVYLLCVGSSLCVNIANHFLDRSGWFLLLPVVIIAAIVGITLIPGVEVLNAIVEIGRAILSKHIIIWAVSLLLFAGLWKLNMMMMNADVYRTLQGKKISDSEASFNLPFLDRLGEYGVFINLEIKMILRSKRFKSQLYMGFFFIVYYFFIMGQISHQENYFSKLFFAMFVIGWLGIIMGQFIFTSESSFFDGLMTRRLSLLQMLKSKYVFYVAYSILMLFILSAMIFTGRIDFLFLISVFFYTNGFVFFMMFQNAVFNKSFLDHSESGKFNWKSVSGSTWILSMLGMFVPVVLVILVKVLFGETVACYYMLVVGILFTATSNYWLKWIYHRFLKRKYMNMEGFRSNT